MARSIKLCLYQRYGLVCKGNPSFGSCVEGNGHVDGDVVDHVLLPDVNQQALVFLEASTV